MTAERQRAHPASVTATRINDTVARYLPYLTRDEQEAARVLMDALREVAAGDRIGRRNR